MESRGTLLNLSREADIEGRKPRLDLSIDKVEIQYPPHPTRWNYEIQFYEGVEENSNLCPISWFAYACAGLAERICKPDIGRIASFNCQLPQS